MIRPHTQRCSIVVLLLAMAAAGRGEETPDPATGPIAIESVALDRPVDFATDIQPILTQNCTACHHGQDGDAGLSLEEPTTILAGGDSGPAANLQQPEQSLILRVASRQEKPYMPPRRNKVGASELTPRELGLIKLWIEQGAKGAARRVRKEPQWQAPPQGWNPIYTVALSPDGQHAAAGRGNRIHIYNLPLGKLVATLTDPKLEGPLAGAAHFDSVQSLAFSSDGTLLASGGYRSIKLWRNTLLERRLKVPAPQSPARGSFVASSPDAKWLVTAGPGPEVRITELATGTVTKELPTTAPAIRQQQLAADILNFTKAELALYTTQVDGFAKAVEAQNAALAAATTAKQAAEQDIVAKQAALDAATVELAAFVTKQAETAEALKSHEAKLKEATAALETAKSAGQPAEQVAAAQQAVDQATLTMQQAQAAGQEAAKQVEAGTAKQAESQKALTAAMQARANAEQQIQAAQAAIEQQQQLMAVAQASKDRAAAAVREAEVRYQEAGDAISAPRSPTAVVVSPDSSAVLVGSRDGSVQIFGMPAGGGPGVLKLHAAPIVALSFTADGELISTAADGEVRIGRIEPAWQLERTMEAADSTAPPVDRVTALAFSPDGKFLASGGGVPSREGELLLWNTADGQLARRFDKPHGDTVLDLAFFHDGTRLATAAADRFAKVFDPATGELIRAFEGHTNHVLSVSWNRNGHRLATAAADKTLKLWNFHEGTQIRTIDGFDKPLTRVRHLGYREELAVSWGVGRAQLIHENATRGKPFDAGADYVHALDTTPDGRTVATGGQDGILRVWDAATGQLLAAFEPPI